MASATGKTDPTGKADDPYGRNATSPLGLPRHAWREVLGRVWTKIGYGSSVPHPMITAIW